VRTTKVLPFAHQLDALLTMRRSRGSGWVEAMGNMSPTWVEEEEYVADMNRAISLMRDARQKINQTSSQIQCHKEHRQFSTDQEPG
jgi:hypothetical protein